MGRKQTNKKSGLWPRKTPSVCSLLTIIADASSRRFGLGGLRKYPRDYSTTAGNSQLCELRIDDLIEDGRGPQWRPESAEIFIFRNILWPSGSSQILLVFRNILLLLLILIVGSRSMHYSSFASHKKSYGPTNRQWHKPYFTISTTT